MLQSFHSRLGEGKARRTANLDGLFTGAQGQNVLGLAALVPDNAASEGRYAWLAALVGVTVRGRMVLPVEKFLLLRTTDECVK